MPRKINKANCIACGTCERVCIIGCISQDENRKRVVNTSACVDCGACQLACPMKCIEEII